MTHGRPTAAPAYFPYRHDNMFVVMVREGTLWKSCGHERKGRHERGCRTCKSAYARARYERERRSVAG